MNVKTLKNKIFNEEYYFTMKEKDSFQMGKTSDVKLFNLDNNDNVELLILNSGIIKKTNLNCIKDLICREAEITERMIKYFNLRSLSCFLKDTKSFENLFFLGYEYFENSNSHRNIDIKTIFEKSSSLSKSEESIIQFRKNNKLLLTINDIIVDLKNDLFNLDEIIVNTYN